MTEPGQARHGSTWRLLIHEPSDGAWNMAVDEALLAGYSGVTGPSAPTLRLYAWAPPALSLGKGQPAMGAHDPRFLREQGIDLVRRPTGGRAVLHERECTYAVIGHLGREPFSSGVLETYRRIGLALERGLRALGVAARAEARAAAGGGSRGEVAAQPSCFAFTSAHEITVRGLKLVGSAQLRRGRAFLQHGSIPLRSDPARVGRALGLGQEPAGSTDLVRALGGPPAPGALERALVRGFEAVFGSRLRSSALTPAEALLAERLRCWKYDSAAWTLCGRMGARERHWGPAISSAR